MMSKNDKPVFAAALAILLLAAASVYAVPERVDIRIELTEIYGSYEITGRFIGREESRPTNLSFVDQYADAVALAKRVVNPTVTDAAGSEINIKRFNDGEYVAAEPYSRFRYGLEIVSPEPVIASPHISWTYGNRSLLKMRDMLPEIRADLFRISLVLPKHWRVATVEKMIDEGVFETESLENAVFLIGVKGIAGLRTQYRRFHETDIEFSMLDQWQFTDDVVAGMTVEILGEYRKLFGWIPRKRLQINLLKFPLKMENDRWRAQTQGGTVTIVSSDSTYPNLAPQRLHEQLRHELFHLWIPEAVGIEGDYAWFYEGFAQYQSLKAGVWVGRLSFDDFLKSMSEALNIASFDRSKLSLPELSRARWQSGPGLVSARGMSVAFLCDAILLETTKRKKNVGDVLTSLFVKHALPADRTDSAKAVEAALLQFPQLKSVVGGQINANEAVDWGTVLKPFGIEVVAKGTRVSLNVVPKPTRKQKALLNKLGYNRWKDLPRS